MEEEKGDDDAVVEYDEDDVTNCSDDVIVESEDVNKT